MLLCYQLQALNLEILVSSHDFTRSLILAEVKLK